MRGMGKFGKLGAIWVTATLMLSACWPTDPAHADSDSQTADLPATSLTTPEPVAAATPTDWPESPERITALADSVDRQMRKVRGLSRQERAQLRRDVNAVQIERARQLGIPPGSSLEPMISAGRLIRLPDTTRYWVVRHLKYSEPYLTPSATAMLREIAERFQARLDTLSVPRYRLDITSVLRTSDKQAALRRANSNASRIESAHEFGTTVDIAYRKFAAPASPQGFPLQPFRDSLLEQTANQRSGELQAVLGRVLAEMQNENKLLVRMERRQTVYHITVGRQLDEVKTPSR